MNIIKYTYTIIITHINDRLNEQLSKLCHCLSPLPIQLCIHIAYIYNCTTLVTFTEINSKLVYYVLVYCIHEKYVYIIQKHKHPTYLFIH